MPKTSGIRIFAEINPVMGEKIALNAEQSHYLLNVMRLSNDDKILVFNSRDGEFEAKLIVESKKKAVLDIIRQTREQANSPDIWLIFAPLKKDRTDFVIEKATELGVAKIVPVVTRYGITDKIKYERWIAQATEASEQSRRLDIPTIADSQPLEKLLADWDEKRHLYFMDETGQGISVIEAFSQAPTPLALLIGPEGGFSEAELSLLHSLSFATPVCLGKRILRAETAAITAVACWQALSGDWR